MSSGSGKLYKQESEISPTEDLMREHGVLTRILLIYKKIANDLLIQKFLSLDPLNSILFEATVIVQNFIDNYHQRLEEEYLFPRFLQGKKHIELVNVLQEQHNASRYLTCLILQYLSSQSIYNPLYRLRLARILLSYARMYEPHSAREDTVLFPAFREMVEPDELGKLGERFEEIEEKKFGKGGFENIINKIAGLEQLLGIYNLSQFTPAECACRF